MVYAASRRATCSATARTGHERPKAVKLPATLAVAASTLEKRFGRKLLERMEDRGDLTYSVAPEDWSEVLGACRHMPELAFDQLDCLLGDHLPERVAAPFAVVAHLVSHTHGHRLRIKTALTEGQKLRTVTALWPSAGFDEREAGRCSA